MPTSQPIVLVTFSCQTGQIEKLALSAAVGAVQARALIRLRRIPDVDPVSQNAEAVRMRKEYVAPAETDVAGADALIFAADADTNALSAPWQNFFDLLLRLSGEGKLNGKVGAAIGGLSPALAGLGFVTVTQLSSDPLALGRSVAEMARSLKSS
jgi:multimeric flavodoxin WrbA